MKEIKKFIEEYKNPLLISFFFFVGVYLFKMVAYSFSVDTATYMINRSKLWNDWLTDNRYMLVLLKKMFQFIPFNIVISNILTVVIFYISCVLCYFNLSSVSPKWKDAKKLIPFMCIIGSSPILLEQFNFTLQNKEIAFFFLLLQCSIYCYIKFIQDKKIYKGLLSSLFLFICIGAYQGFAPLFITEIIMIVFLTMDKEKKSSFKKVWNMIWKSMAIFLISFIVYFGLAKLILVLFHLNESTYISGSVGWFHKSFGTIIRAIYHTFITTYFGTFQQNYLYSLLNTATLIIGLIEVFKYFANKKGFQGLLLGLLLLCPLLLNIVVGNLEPARSQFSLPFVVAFFLIYFGSSKKWYQGLLWLLIIVQFFTCLIYEMNDYKRYKFDRDMAFDIYEIVKDDLDGRKLILVGGQSSYPDGKILKGEMMGVSIFNHGNLAIEGVTFMKDLGYDVEGDNDYLATATELVKDSDVYPSLNSIVVTDDYVIVKLS